MMLMFSPFIALIMPNFVGIVALAVILLLIFANRRKKKKTEKGKKNSKDSSKEPKTIVRCSLNGEWDVDGTNGYYKDGKVFCITKLSGDFEVGTYVKNGDGSLKVYDTNGDHIGTVQGSHVILTKEGAIERFEKNGWNTDRLRKYPVTFDCAELFSNCITDRTREMNCVALCDGSPESAAVFICMHRNGLNLCTAHSIFSDFWTQGL